MKKPSVIITQENCDFQAEAKRAFRESKGLPFKIRQNRLAFIEHPCYYRAMEQAKVYPELRRSGFSTGKSGFRPGRLFPSLASLLFTKNDACSV